MLATEWVANGLSISRVLAIRIRVTNFVLFLGLLLLWHLIFRMLGMYRSARLKSRWMEVRHVLQATFWGTLAISNAAMLFNIRLVTPAFIAVFFMTSSLLTMAERQLVREFLAHVRREGRNLRNLLIVGTNPRALDFAERIEARLELGYRIIGFVDEEWQGIDSFRQSGRPLVASPDELRAFLRGNVVDEVVVALPLGSSYERTARIIEMCEEQGITVRFLSDLFKLKLARATVEVFEDEPVVTIWTGAMDGWSTFAKRGLDILLSAALLLVFLPLLAVTALLVKLTSPGPVFFLQQRVGFNKRKFNVHKFRTMVVDAEARMAEIAHLNEVEGPVFKITHDPRLTPIGKILRKTSIDELPQLWDVLAGNMSLVGPRPLPVRDFQGFDKDWHRRRFSVRPGITCLWQVNGRSSLPFERWMELDMQYIDQWSLWLDLKILVATIPAVLKGSGAA